MKMTPYILDRITEATRTSMPDGSMVKWAANVSSREVIEKFFYYSQRPESQLNETLLTNNFKLFEALNEYFRTINYNYKHHITLQERTVKFIDENADSIFDLDNNPELLLLYKLVVLK